MADSQRAAVGYSLIIAALLTILVTLSWQKIEHVDLDASTMAQFGGLAYATSLAPVPGYTSVSDSAGIGKSRVVLLEDGHPLPYPHAIHADIAERGAGRYSHWGTRNEHGEYLIFAASDSTDPRTNGRKYQAIRPHRIAPLRKLVLLFIACAALVGGCLAVGEQLIKHAKSSAQAFERPMVIRALSRVATATPLVLSLAFAGATAFCYDTLGPIARPPTDFTGFIEATARSVHVYPHLVVWTGLLLYIVSLRATSTPTQRRAREVPLLGALVAVSAALFLTSYKIAHDSGALGGALAYMNFIGGTPYSDAHGYFSCMHLLEETARWDVWCNRRPAAAAMRAVTFLFGGDATGAIHVQNVLLSLTLGAAAQILGRCFGLGSALVFTGLVLLHAAPFSATLMTEPLGIFWAVCSVIVTIFAWRSRSLFIGAFALPAIAATALLIRMGAMFTAVSVAAWSIFRFRENWPKRILSASVVTIALALAWGSSVVLSSAYGGGRIGGNFAYTLYGISVGKDWSAALTEIPHTNDETENIRRIYSAAVENIQSHPTRTLLELLKREALFVRKYPGYFVSGYEPRGSHAWWPVLIFCLSAGVLFVLRKRRSGVALSFIGSYLLALAISAPIIVVDDGMRVMAASTVYVAFFVAYFLQSPCSEMLPNFRASDEAPLAASIRRAPKLVAALTTGLFLSLFLAPALLAFGHQSLEERGLSLAEKTDEITLGKGLGLKGFVVSEAGGPDILYHHVSARELAAATAQLPSTAWSSWSDVGVNSKVALFAAYVPEYRASAYFVGPSEIIERRDVEFWRAVVAPGGGELREIISANPYPND